MVELIKYSFVGGVFAPELHGRSDLEKYADGFADSLNWFVDYRGGAITRPGSELASQLPSGAVRLITFRFNNKLANNYLIILTPERLFFAQDGGLVVEGTKSAEIVAGVATVSSHGYATGDLVVLDRGTFAVGATTTNTFEILNLKSGALFSITESGASVARAYSIDTPYEGDDLYDLVFEQRRDTIFITSSSYKRRQLIRSGHTSWTLGLVPTAAANISPAGQDHDVSDSGTAAVAWAVTSVNHDGQESALRLIALESGLVDYTATAGWIRFKWNSVADAFAYRVYRSIVMPEISQDIKLQQLGFIGEVHGLSILDRNISPDFTRTPPQENDPFMEGGIYEVRITNVGSGYTSATVSASGGGSGFSAEAVIVEGELRGVLIYNPGSGYTSPTITVSGDGSGATVTAVATDTSGNSPQASVFWRQALWYAGTTNNPIRLTSTRAGSPFDFKQTNAFSLASPQDLTIDTEDMTPIKHLGVLGSSLLAFTGSSIWAVYVENDQYNTRAQTRSGASAVPPLFINREALYVLESGNGVWSLTPTNLPDYLTENDRSIYSGHLFSQRDPIVAWSWARNPYRLVWATTRSGRALSLTYVSEQNVYAWAPHNTQGFFRSCTSVFENDEDRTYFAVERENGLFLERLAQRDHQTVEDIWSVDCAVAVALPTPSATIFLSDDETTITANAGVFSSGDEGSHIRAGGARWSITEHISSTEVRVITDIDLAELPPQDFRDIQFAEGEWSLAKKQTNFSGLDHLEGQTVEIFADGRSRPPQVVEDGSITLEIPSSKVVVGLGFDGFLKTLPLTASDAVIEARKKRVTQVSARLYRSRGLQIGATLDTTYPGKERTDERIQEPTRFVSEVEKLPVLAAWDFDGSIVFRKEGPICGTVLGVIAELELGDDYD